MADAANTPDELLDKLQADVLAAFEAKRNQLRDGLAWRDFMAFVVDAHRFVRSHGGDGVADPVIQTSAQPQAPHRDRS